MLSQARGVHCSSSRGHMSHVTRPTIGRAQDAPRVRTSPIICFFNQPIRCPVCDIAATGVFGYQDGIGVILTVASCTVRPSGILN